MIARPLVCAMAGLAAACSSSDSGTAPASITTTTLTLGPAEATSAYRPSGLPAAWTGFCPVATPSTVIITAGNAYQIINQSGRAVDLITLPNRGAIETIAAGAGRVVNAIPAVVAAPPGIRTTLDLPLITGKGLFDAD